VKQKLFVLSLIGMFVLSQLLMTACKNTKEFAAISEADLATFVSTLSDSQQRSLAQNQNSRKQMLDQFKKMFGLAQAAVAEGLDKGEEYATSSKLDQVRGLAVAFSKKNETFQVAKADIDAYVGAHQKEFDADLAFITKNSKQAPDAAQIESFKAQWGEMQLRADKGRQAGLDKDPGTLMQMKIQRANLLANLYSNKLQEQFKATDADREAYFKQNPELHPDKVKEKVAALADRLKKGEAFEKVADEINEDGTKGQGGDLGWFGKGAMDPDFEKAAFALQAGQVTPDPIKSSFGYHLIKVVERRKAGEKPPVTPGTVGSSISEVAGAANAAEEIHGKHIYIGTRTADEALEQLAQEKTKRAMEDISLKFPVAAPADFVVKAEGIRQPSGTPALGSGDAGSMKMIDPNSNK
jgi:parvulin-like peptidyl-prolyl isomerase